MQVFPSQPPPQKFFHMPRFNTNFQKGNNYFNPHQYKQHVQQNQNVEFDGKRLRKAVVRKTIDYNSAIINQLQARLWQRDYRDQRALQPDSCYYTELFPPMYSVHNSINAVTTKFVRTSTNKMRCPIFVVVWTPEGRRLVTGASSGEFTLWNGLTFNFETILQAHDSPVRCMVWSHNDTWMVTGDHAGYVKYWQSNMNNVKMFQAHKEPLRGISFCPTDTKFATCSDDGTVRVWDFARCHEEKILRGHGADVKCVDWHPQKGLIVSGSKDSQQPIKLWDPKNGISLATLHAHKNTVMEVKWNQNGNWMLTASRDHLIKLFDIRNLAQEVQTFRGHKKEVSCLSWHPIHESLFASGGSDGSIMFWVAGADKEVGAMEQAHDSIVWSLAWHPLGHILCSGSNDHSSKFWTRNRPGDKMRDKYNLNTLPGASSADDGCEYDDLSITAIPGMGLEHGLPDHLRQHEQGGGDHEMEGPAIPGLDFGVEESGSDKPTQKKVPYAKPIPRQFQQQWMENKRPLLAAPPKDGSGQPVSTPGPGETPPNIPEQNFMPRGPPDGGPMMRFPGPPPPGPPPPGPPPHPMGMRMHNPRMMGPGPGPGPGPQGTMQPPNQQFMNNSSGREDPRSRGAIQGGMQDRNKGDVDQRGTFQYRDSHQQDNQEDYGMNNYGDSDFRHPPDGSQGGYGEDRPYGEEVDPRLRMHPEQFKEFGGASGRGMGPPMRGRGRGGPPPPRQMHEYGGDSDLRMMDSGRGRRGGMAGGPGGPGGPGDMDERGSMQQGDNNSSYQNMPVRKRPWEEGPGDGGGGGYYGAGGMQRDGGGYMDNYGEMVGGGGRGGGMMRGGPPMRGRGPRGPYRGGPRRPMRGGYQ